ncbi:MAG TPA: hypothetical protein VGO45_09710 [Bacteroidia bacterium]|jgi:hypothetical protein|nr:hypothetical protein [Bacteroidia bacterium]
MNAETTYNHSFADGTCLSTVALRQYIDGTLPRKSLHLVEKHLLDCDFCSQVLEDIDVSESSAVTIDAISQNVNQRISELIGSAPEVAGWFRPRHLIVTGLALLLLTGSWLFYHYSGSPASDHVTKPSIVLAEKAPLPVSSVTIPQTSAKTVKEDEFIIHRTETSTAPAVSKNNDALASKSIPIPATANTPAPLPLPEVKNSSPAANPAVAPAKETPPLAEPAAEKEIINDLQIVSARVLQKMTKTEGTSRSKSKKNGQLVAPSDRGAAYKLEDMPEFPGGDAAMEDYLEQSFKNPVKDKRTLTGKAVGVMFTVSSRGKISEVEITKSISPELDVEIIRLISSMPQWSAGKHKGDITCVLALTVR